MRIRTVAVAAGLAVTAVPAAASTVILSPVAATASSVNTAVLEIDNTIDQSGLSIGFTSGVTDFDAYFSQTPLHSFLAANNEWFSAFDVTSATVTYDLGAVFDVTRFALWNEDAAGFGTADVAYSTDDVAYTGLGTLSPAPNPVNADYPAEFFNLSFTGRFFRMELSGCPQPGGTGFQGCSIGEVAFGVRSNDVGVIPLPGALPLMLGGFGLLGFMATRRPQVQQLEAQVIDIV